MAGAAGSLGSFGNSYSVSRRHGGSESEEASRFARCKPESIDKLCRITKFSKEELQLIYRGFKQQCPNGFLKEETLKNIFSSFFPQGDSSEYAHYVFMALDTERSGSINFERFIWTLSLLSRGTVEEKLRWIFQLYDIDGDGFLARDELILITTAIYHMMGKWTRPAFSNEAVEDHVDDVLKKMNSDSDGYVSFPNFLSYCLGDRIVLESMQALDTTMSMSNPTSTSLARHGSAHRSKKAHRTSTIEVIRDEEPNTLATDKEQASASKVAEEVFRLSVTSKDCRK